MNRKQILRRLLEDFTAKEIEAINKQEEFARNAIAKIINDLNDGTEVIKRSVRKEDPEKEDPFENAKEWAYGIADKIYVVNPPKKVSNKKVSKKDSKEGPEERNSKIYQAIESEIEQLLTSSKYIKHAENIFKAIKNSKLVTSDLLRESLSLSEVSNDSKVQNFLLDLYNITLHFGGGNTIGKGELLLAAIISDVKLASHTQKGSKIDIFNTKTNLPIELKHDGGRLDGSGVKPKRFEASELFDVIDDTLLHETPYKKSIKQLCIDTKEEDWKEPTDIITRIQKSLEKPSYVTNPFSRKSIEDLWFVDVPSWIEEISDSCALLDVDVQSAKFLTNIFLKIYSSIYSEGAVGSIEARFISEGCKELAKNCLDVKDVESFILVDTSIRARIYMRLSKSNDPEKSGYLVFMKPTGDNLTLCCIDYTAAGGDMNQWKDKGSKRLHITPGNDDRRASHQIHVK